MADDAPRPRRRGGPTQPEHLRDNEQVKLRLPPPVAAHLRGLAAVWGLSVSETVAELLTRVGGDPYEPE